MRALVITPKNNHEFEFVSDLLKKLGLGVSSISKEELEDIGLSKLLQKADRSKKVSRNAIMKKLSM